MGGGRFPEFAIRRGHLPISGRTTKSTSWVARGTPYTELAREPPTKYGTSSSTRTAAMRAATTTGSDCISIPFDSRPSQTRAASSQRLNQRDATRNSCSRSDSYGDGDAGRPATQALVPPRKLPYSLDFLSCAHPTISRHEHRLSAGIGVVEAMSIHKCRLPWVASAYHNTGTLRSSRNWLSQGNNSSRVGMGFPARSSRQGRTCHQTGW